MFGKKISEKTRLLKSEIFSGNKNPFFGKNHSDTMIEYLSDIKKGKNNPMYGKSGLNSPTFGRKRPRHEVEKMIETRRRK